MKELIQEWRLFLDDNKEIEQLTEVATCHSPDTGRWAKCEKGAVYSLSKQAAEDNNIDPSYVQRGTVTKREKGKPPKLKTKFGVNASSKEAGRISIPSGKDIEPRFSVSKYPERYEETKGQKHDPNWPSSKKIKRDRSYGKPNRKNHFHGYEEMNWLSRGLGLGLMEELEDDTFSLREIVEAILEAFSTTEAIEEQAQNGLQAKCRSIGLISLGEAQKRILVALDAFARARDGKLREPVEK